MKLFALIIAAWLVIPAVLPAAGSRHDQKPHHHRLKHHKFRHKAH